MKVFLVVPVLYMLGVSYTQHVVRTDRDVSVDYFRKMAAVMQHPRCLNCHPRGDQPTQGTDMHTHVMNVWRGLDNHGAVAMKCAACTEQRIIRTPVFRERQTGALPRKVWDGLV